MRGRLLKFLFVAACAWAQPQRVVQQGIAVDFQSEALGGGDTRFRFHISDTAGGSALKGLRPAAWLDARRSPAAPDDRACTAKVAEFAAGSLFTQPAADLNSWYVLAMNEDASISVVDPRFGFGGSQLLSELFLDSPAEDWALSENQQRLFVSLPEAHRVVVADTNSWKVIGRLDLPERAGRLALQPGEKYLWASYESGVAVFDPQSWKQAVRIATGAGPHEIAFSDDGRLAFLTNRDAGSITVIDAVALQKIADIETGTRPVSVAYSPLSRLAYVAHEGAGGIVAVSGSRKDIVMRIASEPGLSQIRFAPGGRFGIAVNPSKDQLQVIDASSNRRVQTSTIHGGPDQVSFTDTLAYLRLRESANVLMIPLDHVGIPDAPLPLVDFPGGELPLGKGSSSPANSIVQVPGEGAVLVANAADKAVYYYSEGMAAPMGHFANYGHEPRAVMVVDRGLEELPGGVYQTVARVPRAGTYDVVFYLDSPRVVQCFELRVASPPGAPPPATAVVVQPVAASSTLPVQEPARIRFRVLDAGNGHPIAGLRDVTALVFLQPGAWQTRPAALEVEPGIYEFTFTPPSAGLYYSYFQSPSLGIKFNSPHVLTFTAETQPAAVQPKE
jgi:YVTN family beta-propeller protein